jgi:AGZA family xanthine/uracil permease-like MFS transporter
MKHSFAVGIGLFLAFIGLYETGIVTSFVAGMPVKEVAAGGHVNAPPVPVKIGNFRDPEVLLAIAGFTVMALLLAWKVRGAILLGMVSTAIAGYAIGLGHMPARILRSPFAHEFDLSEVALHLDVVGALQMTFLPILLTLFLMSFLDTLGTLTAVGATGGMLDKEGNFPDIERPMLVDAGSCIFASLVGTSTSGAYLESAVGIRDGARTGLAAVATAVLFAISLFLLPLVEPLQQMRYVYGPALISVGLLMLGSAARIEFDDLTEAVPAFATIAMVLFTYNIGNGLTAGLVLYPIMKIGTGRYRELHGGSIVLAVMSLVYFLFGVPH